MFVAKWKYMELEAKYQEKCEEIKRLSSSQWEAGKEYGIKSVTVDEAELKELKELRLLSYKLENYADVKAQLAVEKAKVEAMLKLANALNHKGDRDE